MRFESRIFKLAKDPEHPGEYQDACQVDDARGIAVIADGVSSAIFSAQWANVLVDAVIAEAPNPNDGAAFAAWLQAQRRVWTERIETSTLAWFQRAKLPLGAFSTLLWIRIVETDQDQPGAFGAYRLQGFAIGDSCLFHVRRGELVRSFPLQTSAEFQADPIVLGSIDLKRDHLMQFMVLDELCYPDDLLVLCTDALAEWSMRLQEAGTGPDWDSYRSVSEADWQAQITALRNVRPHPLRRHDLGPLARAGRDAGRRERRGAGRRPGRTQHRRVVEKGEGRLRADLRADRPGFRPGAAWHEEAQGTGDEEVPRKIRPGPEAMTMRCSCGRENALGDARCPQCGKRLLAGMDPRRVGVDAAALLTLAAALGLVFLCDRGCAGRPGEVQYGDAGCDRRLQLAVTPPQFDDMGKLLDTLGSGYRYTNITWEDLLDAQKLRKYDVVFLTCGRVPDEWLAEQTVRGQRDSAGFLHATPEIGDRLPKALRRFVYAGGTLYASDWQFGLVAIAFPEFIDRAKSAGGAVQTVHADVIDRGLQKLLGKTTDLKFERPAWQPAAFQESKVTTAIRGSYQTESDGRRAAPLLVRFPYGEGTVIFTSFHNEAQNSETELQLLRYLVFSAVNAQLDAGVQRNMVRGGFSPVERNLLSASGSRQSLVGAYDCGGARSLQFVLVFEDRGARLRLAVAGPDGARLVQEGTKTFTIEVPEAAAGKWQYTVTPVEVPYPNFPFSVTVGEK